MAKEFEAWDEKATSRKSQHDLIASFYFRGGIVTGKRNARIRKIRVIYETGTEGPFYRVRPSRSQAAAGEGRGIVERVRDEAVAPGRTGSDVSQPTTDEAVKQAMSDPAKFCWRNEGQASNR